MELEDNKEDPCASNISNPISETQGRVKLKRGRPPKMRRELQVSLSPLSPSCTQLLLQKISDSGGSVNRAKSSESEVANSKILKRGRPRKVQAKIKFNFFSGKVGGSTKNSSEDTLPEARSTEKELRECADNNSGSTESKCHQEEDQVDLAWADDFGFYRPVRAAAAAALEAVQGRKTQDELIRLRLRNKVFTKQPPPKGRSRRSIRKRTNTNACKVLRGITTRTTTIVCQSVFHRGIYYQEGDIVTITGEDEQEYYCQIKSLMRDFNFEACGNLRWLIPKTKFKGSLIPFNPANFKVCEGVPEQIISLDCVKFLMHCPNDYFYKHSLSYSQPVKGTVYLRLGEKLVTVEKVPIPITQKVSATCTYPSHSSTDNSNNALSSSDQ